MIESSGNSGDGDACRGKGDLLIKKGTKAIKLFCISTMLKDKQLNFHHRITSGSRPGAWVGSGEDQECQKQQRTESDKPESGVGTHSAG